MRTPLLLSVVLFSITLFASPAGAVKYHKIKTNMSGPDVLNTAGALLVQHKKQLGWVGVDLSPRNVVSSKTKQFVAFDQVYQGMRVMGREVKVELDHNGAPLRVFGNPLSDLSLKVPTLINPAQAIMAIEDMEDRILPLDLGGEIVVMAHGKKPVIAYLFSISTGVHLYRYFVDALSGKVLIKQQGFFNAYGKVFLLDPALTPDATEVELQNLTADATYLDGYEGQFKVWQCVTAPDAGGMMGATPDIENATLISIPTSDASGNYIYEPVLDLDYTELAGAVNLFYHVDRMYTGFRSLGYTAPLNMDIIANLHSESGGTKTPYDNAFFTPSQDMSKDIITAGQGTDIDLAYGGDVIMHEFTHSVIYHVAIGLDAQQFDQYGIHRMPLAIHEGLADYFPSSLNNSPVMGAWALEEIEAGASRNLENNTKICPDDMLGEEHYDGEILGAASWAIRQAVGGPETADPIIYATLLRLSSNSTYKDFHESLVLSLADALTAGDITQTQHDDALAVSVSKGLDICGRYLPLDSTESNSTAFGLNMLAQAMGGTCSQMRGMLNGYNAAMPTLFQYAVHVPAGTTSLTLNLDLAPLEMDTDVSYHVYGRGGEMVQYDLVSIYGFQVPAPADYDVDFSDGGSPYTSMSQQIVWTINDETPLPTDQDVYFAIAHLNCPTAAMTLSATTSSDPIENPDAGVDGDTDADADSGTDTPKTSEDGCKCSSAGASSPTTLPSFFLLLLGGFLAFTLRRRLSL
ncbi:hypothetical protein KKF84_09320 [Myxococcota bacterium]|nr:hypothetical protein [Myxococcota bacterium]MBU1535509.1 hypothetical protein [Myxococcota bacterium]